MKNFIEKLILHADLFASPPTMSLSGRSKIHSPIGSFLSLLVFGVGVWLFIYLGSDMINKTNPRVSQISTLRSTPVALDAEKNILRFGFSNGYDNWAYLFDERYFSIKAEAYKSAIDNYHSPTFTPISFQKCESVLYPGTELICLKEGTVNGEPIVFGENVDSVIFSFSQCDYYQRPDCQYPKLIISASRLQWENYDYAVDLNNYKEPFGQAFAPKDDPLDGSSLTIVTYQNRYTTVNSYDGWILTSPSVEQRTTIWSKTVSRTPIQNDGVFLKVEITKGGENLEYYRQYPQIQNVLASVGGVLGILMLAFRILLSPYNKFAQKALIVKSVYNVKYPGKSEKPEKVYISSDPEDEETQRHSVQIQTRGKLGRSRTLGEIQMTQRTTSENPMITETRRETNFVLSENEDGIELQSPMSKEHNQRDEQRLPDEGNQFASLSMSKAYWSPRGGSNQTSFRLESKRNREEPKKKVEIDIQPKQGIHRRNKEFDVGLLKWLWSFVRPQVEVDITKKAVKEVDENIDILSIVKMKREINLLKQVLLSESQRTLFDNIQPPQISINKNNKIEVESLRSHFEGDQFNAEKTYSRLSRLDNKSHLDEKILTFYKKQK